MSQPPMDERSFVTQEAKSSKDVLAFYDQYAPTWDARFGQARSTRAFHRLRLRSFLKVARLKPSDRIAELGVGTGPYLSEIAPRVNEVLCFDGSPRMLEVLRSRNSSLGNIKIFLADLEQPVQGGPFDADVVYFCGLIEHVINVDAFLKNVQRIVKKGGRIVIVTPNGRCPWYGKLRLKWRAGSHCSSDRYYTKSELDEIMLRHGFAPESAHFWGYFPAGIGTLSYGLLRGIGFVIGCTPLKVYAGGLTLSYICPG